MAERKNISTELESRLGTLAPGQHMNVLITADSPEHYVALNNYLTQQGVTIQDADRIPTLNTISAHLTRKQIYNAATQPYVRAILENQKLGRA